MLFVIPLQKFEILSITTVAATLKSLNTYGMSNSSLRRLLHKTQRKLFPIIQEQWSRHKKQTNICKDFIRQVVLFCLAGTGMSGLILEEVWLDDSRVIKSSNSPLAAIGIITHVKNVSCFYLRMQLVLFLKSEKQVNAK